MVVARTALRIPQPITQLRVALSHKQAPVIFVLLPGSVPWQMVDFWPRSVARLSEGRKRAVIPLEGNHDAAGPLTAPKEANGGSEALKRARRAHELLVEALAELRPHVPAPPPPQSEGEEPPPTTASSPSRKLAGGKGGPVFTGDFDEGSAERAMSVAESEVDTEEEISAAGGGTGGGGGRRGRKRARVEEAAAVGGSRLYKLRGREAEDEGGGGGGGGNENNGYSEEEEDEEGGAGGGKGGPLSAADMTVAAVRGSLLRNRSDEGPYNPEVEEWESVVKKFILHVESLPPGTEQEELSLMFAAALDPTLVRMRAANTSLIKLAEVCASEDRDGGGSDGGSDGGGKGGGGKGGGGSSTATRRKNGFNVFLELEAVDGEEAPPPAPAGIDKIRRAVTTAAVAVEAVGRADACVVHAGDTLGGLRELKTDYRRSLPPGPREPVRFQFGSRWNFLGALGFFVFRGAEATPAFALRGVLRCGLGWSPIGVKRAPLLWCVQVSGQLAVGQGKRMLRGLIPP